MRLLVATRTGITALDDGRAEDVWEGQVRCLAREGLRVYAGTASGAVRSVDDGATWAPSGLAGSRVMSLAVDGESVLAGAQPVAVHRSDDGGRTWRTLESFPRRAWWWQPATKPHTQGYVSALATRGDTILAGIEAFRGYRSDDRGGSWRPLRRDSQARIFRWSDGRWAPVTEELRELPHALVCPQPDAVVAGLRDGTLRSSADRGETWETLARVDGVRALV